MARFKKGWSGQDHLEFDAVVAEVEKLDLSTPESGERFMALIDDAIQAHRMWARDVERASRLNGFKATWYRIQRRGLKSVVLNGRKIEKPAKISVRRERADGRQYKQLEFFDRVSLSQIIEGRQYARLMRKAYDENVAVYDKIESFVVSAGVTSVPEAEAVHGVSLDSWLTRKAA